MKRIVGVLLACCMLLTGCGRIDGKLYKDLKKAVDTTVSQTGGILRLQTTAPQQEEVLLTFTYLYGEDDVLHYCLEQTDKTGKQVFLEYNDGKVLQRWLLGHGTVSYDETSSEFTRYTRRNLYAYLNLLASLPDTGALSELSCSQNEDRLQYILTANPEKASGEKKAEEQLISKRMQYTVSPEGMLEAYQEESCYQAADEKMLSYTVAITISDLGNVKEIKLPALE